MISKETLLNNWHIMRIARLGLGIYFIVYAFQMHNLLPGLIATFLLYQAITNSGCCGAEGCNIPTTKKTNTKDIEFEEIK